MKAVHRCASTVRHAPWLVLLMLAGCGGLRSHDALVQTYVLRTEVPAPAAPPPAAAESLATLAIPRPSAAAGLDVDRIVVLRPDGRLDTYSASRWPGNLPDVLQALLIDAERASGKWRAVFSDDSGFAAEYVLQVEVRQFAAEYGAAGPPTAHVLLIGTLGRRDREVLRTVRAEGRAMASEDRMGAVVAAFNQALAEALAQLQQLP